MRRRGSIALVTLLVLAVAGAAPARAAGRALLLVSIDGLMPGHVLEADRHGLRIPTLRRLLAEGAHARGVRGVLPTVTYPSHTTLLTGVWPARHGVYSNRFFDPVEQRGGGWYWYAQDIGARTLFEAAAQAGLPVASLSWPVSVAAPGVKYLLPEYWRTPPSPDDAKLLRALATPGLVDRLAKAAGPLPRDGDDPLAGDEARTRYAVALLQAEKVALTAIHLVALDHFQHEHGPLSMEARGALEAIDGLLERIVAAARARSPQTVVCVVSDHGFAAVDRTLDLRHAFLDEGLITVDGAHGKVTDWRAMPAVDGGSAAILLKDPRDEATRARTRALLDRLAADPEHGIARVLDPAAIAQLGGRPDAAFWVDMRPGFTIGGTGGPLVAAGPRRGTHGYLPTHEEMLASFFLAGPGVARGLDLGEIDMRAVAPTLAALLGLSLPGADLPPLPLQR